MTSNPVGIQHEDGTVTHTPDAIRYALSKSVALLEREGMRDAARIVADLRDGKVREAVQPPRPSALAPHTKGMIA